MGSIVESFLSLPPTQVDPSDTVTTAWVHSPCPRCGYDHQLVVFYLITKPGQLATWEGKCPTTRSMIFMHRVDGTNQFS